MRRSNGRIPIDELLLAEAIAAVTARGLRASRENYFVDAEGCEAKLETAVGCCALAALVIAGRARFYRDRERYPGPLPKSVDPAAIARGNDDAAWGRYAEDLGETMGHAFQLAMAADIVKSRAGDDTSQDREVL